MQAEIGVKVVPMYVAHLESGSQALVGHQTQVMSPPGSDSTGIVDEVCSPGMDSPVCRTGSCAGSQLGQTLSTTANNERDVRETDHRRPMTRSAIPETTSEVR